MIAIILFGILIFILMVLRSVIQQLLQGLVMLLGGSRYQGVLLYSLIFLPGIIVHEMAHFLVATMLGVRTGDISLLPRNDISEDGRVALGTVKVAKTDFVRASLIGAAPFFIGTLALFFCVMYFLEPLGQSVAINSLSSMIETVRYFFTNPRFWFGIYMVFAVANTMFVSKEDAATFPVIAVFIFIATLVIVLSGKWSEVVAWLLPKLQIVISLFLNGLAAAVILDVAMILVFYTLVKIVEKMTKRKVLYGRKLFFWQR